MSIITPYYRTLLERTSTQCAPEPDFNYTPYKLFCLKTKLYPQLHRLLGSDADIRLTSIYQHNKMYLTVVPVRGSQPIVLSVEQFRQLQTIVDSLTGTDEGSCLIFSSEEQHLSLLDVHNKLIPSSWIKSMIPYVYLDPELNPSVNEFGVHAVLTGYPDYAGKQIDLMLDIISQLRKMYEQGYIAHGRQLVEAWDLEPLDDDGIIYRPRWIDRRFAPNLVEFLQSRLQGEQEITITIGENYVRRHFVAFMLTHVAFRFVGSSVRIKVDNLNQARSVSSLVISAVASTVGKVLTLLVTQLSWISIYTTLIGQINPKFKDQCVGYATDDPSRPYTFSCLVPYDTETIALSARLIQLAQQQLEEKKVE